MGNPSWDLRKIPLCTLSRCIKFPGTQTLPGSLQIPGYNNCQGLWSRFSVVPDLKTFLCLCVRCLECFASCHVLIFIASRCLAMHVFGIDLSHKLCGVYCVFCVRLCNSSRSALFSHVCIYCQISLHCYHYSMAV